MTSGDEVRKTRLGRLILVVGPSGAGKDTLIRRARETLAGDPAWEFPKRVVTRLPSEAEDNISMDETDFARMAASGAFAVTWTAHGLSYGISSSVDRSVAEGRSVVCNVSRTVVDTLRATSGNVLVIEVTAPPEVLAHRLRSRRREDDGDPSRRLARSAAIPAIRVDVSVLNDGGLDDAVRGFLEALR